MKKKTRETAESFGVIGLGRFGSALVECLAQSGKEVIAIDKDETRVREARRFTDMALVVGALDRESLGEAGIQNCDTVIICIAEQVDVSILTTMTVLDMKVPHVVAKASSIMHGEVLKRLGAKVVYPERDMAIRLGKGLVYHSFLDSVALEGNVEVRRIQVTEPLIGLTVRETDFRQKYGLNIIAIEHNHHTDVEFSSSYQFKAGDIISVIGQTGNIERFESDMQ
ncbi:TrkA family potassium uptake protein [Zongyangia sp. HA2173]|mgnify:CR=1 FL=1|uniref:potassium channel family protein n=1 Tax=Zongyangia sp. HA2173 TaxID=3133035 RepID=UPI0031615F96